MLSPKYVGAFTGYIYAVLANLKHSLTSMYFSIALPIPHV